MMKINFKAVNRCDLKLETKHTGGAWWGFSPPFFKKINIYLVTHYLRVIFILLLLFS